MNVRTFSNLLKEFMMPLSIEKQNAKMREKLLKSALDLFITKGYYDTAIRDIIKNANVGTGTFYNYFSDKEDILGVLLEDFANQIMQSISDYYLLEENLFERFIETKRITMKVFIQNEKLSEIYCKVIGTSQKIDDRIKKFEDKLIAFYEKNIEYGIKKGSFNDVPIKPIAHSILATEKHLIFRWIVLKDITKDEMVDMVVSFHKTLAKGLIK